MKWVKMVPVFVLGAFLSATGVVARRAPVEQVQQRAGQAWYARAGAWASLCTSVVLGTFITHKTMEEIIEKGFSYLPMVHTNSEPLARVMSGSLIAPLSALFCMRYSKLLWYFFYIIYAAERVSPTLAHDALHDLHVYVRHLNAIKIVQKELNAVIQEIAMVTESMNHEPRASADRSNQRVDPLLVVSIQEVVALHEQYVHTIIEALHEFLVVDDTQVQLLIEALQNHDCCIEEGLGDKGLQQSVHAVVEHLHVSDSKDLGYDAQILNNLVQQLIGYWQSYAMGLAANIDAALRRCRAVHAIEQFVVTTLDRPLHLCNDAHTV